MLAVCGKKWTKRAIGMSAPAQQLQLVWRAARYISLCAKLPPTDPAATAELAASKAEEFSTLLRLRETVLAALPADSKGHLSITEQELRQMGEEAAAWAAAGGTAEGGAVSALSLASVGEALEVSKDTVSTDQPGVTWCHHAGSMLALHLAKQLCRPDLWQHNGHCLGARGLAERCVVHSLCAGFMRQDDPSCNDAVVAVCWLCRRRQCGRTGCILS